MATPLLWLLVTVTVTITRVRAHIILSKSDRTIIYKTGDSRYTPTPIPLQHAAQVGRFKRSS